MYLETMIATFAKLGEIAAPVIKAYHADFFRHDAKVFAGMKPGDVALWKPRESGTCLVIVARGRVVNALAREAFEAYASLFGADGWQQIDCYNDTRESWSVCPTDSGLDTIRIYEEAAVTYKREPVREMHL